jgi:hypothetical protein
MDSHEEEKSTIAKQLGEIADRLDVLINLTLDMLSDERFLQPRKLTQKVKRLDATGIALRPNQIGRIVGRKSKDVSSRRREIASANTSRRARPK